jgi:hypothetical protein
MTNVVGIMVILLTVTQLGVGDAVKRITSTTQVDPEELARLEREVAEAQKLREELIRQLRMLVYHNERRDEAARELALLKKRIVDAQASNRVLEETDQERVQKAREEALAQQDEAKRLLEEQEKEVDAFRQKINKEAELLAKLRAQLADTPEPVSPPAKVVYLPNPRPAPKGAKPLVFLCRDDRVMFVDEDELRQSAQRRVEFVVQRRRLDQDPEKGIDADILGKEVNRLGINDPTGTFNPRLIFHGRFPRIDLVPRDSAGETAAQLAGGSRYRRTLGRIDSEKFYLRYVVWPDGYEVYLEARKIASDMGLSAGWQAVGAGSPYTIPLGGSLRVGPPPPPTPPTKPTEPPKPPPPPPPVDTID